MRINTDITMTSEELLGKELADQVKKDEEEQENLKKMKKLEEDQKAAAENKKKKIILKNTLGEEVSQKDYFYSSKGVDAAPVYFTDVCGLPVDREDMITVFNRIFKPKDGILFYKCRDKEVYIIIVPIKHSSVIGAQHGSLEGEFQKHAISFISEGSVNLETLKQKLTRVASTIKIVAE